MAALVVPALILALILALGALALTGHTADSRDGEYDLGRLLHGVPADPETAPATSEVV